MLLVIRDVLAKGITNEFIYTFLCNKTHTDQRGHSDNANNLKFHADYVVFHLVKLSIYLLKNIPALE